VFLDGVIPLICRRKESSQSRGW